MNEAVEANKADEATQCDQNTHQQEYLIFGMDSIHTSKKYTKKADCTDGNQLIE
ncbi:hypothetical protein CE91St62_39180 [Lachnospiraceae bacterium]|nr:hypothetical protein CE91St61_39310 [Lachnospiraceae bacterium]BDF39857.1 hypothetical protein CE91St62_39180 [Lachnospiraceae bacterium]